MVAIGVSQSNTVSPDCAGPVLLSISISTLFTTIAEGDLALKAVFAGGSFCPYRRTVEDPPPSD